MKRYKIVIIILACISIILGYVYYKNKEASLNKVSLEDLNLNVDLLTVNRYSRPQRALNKVNGLVIHYTANPNSSAKNNRDYFESLKDTKKTKASSHFVIGIDGEIIQCIPTSEIAYASNYRNYDTIAIECCHKDESGKFTNATYKSLVKLCRCLMNKYSLNKNDVIRHYDVTKKKCPLYFVDNEDKWIEFKDDLESYSILDIISL